MFRQHVAGVINLSIPLIILFYMMPGLLITPLGPIFSALLLGIYIWYLNYQQLKMSIARLLYTPSGAHKQLFDGWIQSCDVDSSKIDLRYAYTGEQFAVTMGKVIVIDSVCFSVFTDDIANEPVQNVFKNIIEPGLSENAKKRFAAYKDILTPEVQSFLFKHEVGHVVHKFALKKLLIIFVGGTLSAYVGILTAKYILQINTILAIVLGMTVGGILDLLLSYASNYFFKYFAEKNADLFAARHSSTKDILAAAEFFEKLQEINEAYKDQGNFITKLPIALLGYASGKERKDYLLKFIQNKQ